MKTLIAISAISAATTAIAREYHVGANHELKTISMAAELAQPGDTITVHAGLYRERVDPPRGGTSDSARITYQAAPGDRVVITGAEPLKGWTHVTNNTWKAVIPNSFFGDFNPFAERVHGEWCSSGPLQGAVYLDGDWLDGAVSREEVLKPGGAMQFWHAEVGGIRAAPTTQAQPYLFALRNLRMGDQALPIDSFSAKKPGTEARTAPSKDGVGPLLGWIRPGDWIAFAKIDLGKPQALSLDAGALGDGGVVEFYSNPGTPQAERLGSLTIPSTGDWQKWRRFSVALRAASFGGERTLALLFKAGEASSIPGTDTILWAQFKGVNPNEANVEINVRQSVFYPSKPGLNYITVRGFELRQAATPWAGAQSEQVGLIGTHWSRGWIIENNHIHHSIATGVTLGLRDIGTKPPATAPGFVATMQRALKDFGWSSETIGSHIVRNNHISHCEKNAIHGSLGACFSEISGNEIHDISIRNWIIGADTAGIKFLGGVDMYIRDNHFHRCGDVAGLWLDWSCQGSVVTGNLFHGNARRDIFLEMQHGPITLANNLMLSHPAANLQIWSKGMALAHNLTLSKLMNGGENDLRETPYHPAHSVDIAGLFRHKRGEHVLFNNWFAGDWDGKPFDADQIPNVHANNLFTDLASPSRFDTTSARKAGTASGITLEHRNDGWYLTLTSDPAWRAQAGGRLVTSERLGRPSPPDLPFTHRDGSALRIETDYFGKQRDIANPFPGPFETLKGGLQTIKVWPKR